MIDTNYSKYNKNQIELINKFLNWNNDNKNHYLFRIISKSFDFCMINSKCEAAHKDLTNMVFYLDTNILIKMLGDHTQSDASINDFIKQCREKSIPLHVTSYVYAELKETLEKHINILINNMANLTCPLTPKSMETINESELDKLIYELYYSWFKAGNKAKNYNGFIKNIDKRVTELMKHFVIDDNLVSFSMKDRESFNASYNELLALKKDGHTAQTDTNSILYTLEQRKKDANRDYFIISVDNNLIRWVKQAYPSGKSLIDSPNIWLAIILKYTGRATIDDYSAFCKFVSLPISVDTDNLKIQMQFKNMVLKSNLEDEMKEHILEDVDINRLTFDTNVEKIFNEEKSKALDNIRDKIKKEETKRANEKIATYKQEVEYKHEQELIEQQKQFEEQINISREKGFEEGKQQAKEEIKQNKIRKKVKFILFSHYAIRWLIGIAILIGLAFAIKSFFHITASNELVANWINDNINILLLISSIASAAISFVLKICFPTFNILSVDKKYITKIVTEKYENKLRFH